MAYANIDRKYWPIIDEWLRRLSSGEYEHCVYTLKEIEETGKNKTETLHCALGVMAEVLIDLDPEKYEWRTFGEYKGLTQYFFNLRIQRPPSLAYAHIFRKILTSGQYNIILSWNDEIQLPFPEMAKRFRKNYFRKED